METFTFPDDLDKLTCQRMNLNRMPERIDEEEYYKERISNIIFRKPGQMTFCLDGRKSGVCYLTADEAGWLDTGMITPIQIACRYAANRFTRFTRNPIQKTLFD